MILYKNKCYTTNSDHPDDDWVGNADWVVPDGSELAEKIKAAYPYFEFILDDESNLIDVEITNEPIENIISQKKAELSAECEKAIISGVDVGDVHYSLTIEDQANILAWMAVAQTGKSVPYHCDGQPCRIYSSEEFMEVANAAVAYKTHHTTYCNLLMRQVEAMTDVDDVKAVQYGITQLEGEYAEQYQIIMTSLIGNTKESSQNDADNSTEVTDKDEKSINEVTEAETGEVSDEANS